MLVVQDGALHGAQTERTGQTAATPAALGHWWERGGVWVGLVVVLVVLAMCGGSLRTQQGWFQFKHDIVLTKQQQF